MTRRNEEVSGGAFPGPRLVVTSEGAHVLRLDVPDAGGVTSQYEIPLPGPVADYQPGLPVDLRNLALRQELTDRLGLRDLLLRTELASRRIRAHDAGAVRILPVADGDDRAVLPDGDLVGPKTVALTTHGTGMCEFTCDGPPGPDLIADVASAAMQAVLEASTGQPAVHRLGQRLSTIVIADHLAHAGDPEPFATVEAGVTTAFVRASLGHGVSALAQIEKLTGFACVDQDLVPVTLVLGPGHELRAWQMTWWFDTADEATRSLVAFPPLQWLVVVLQHRHEVPLVTTVADAVALQGWAQVLKRLDLVRAATRLDEVAASRASIADLALSMDIDELFDSADRHKRRLAGHARVSAEVDLAASLFARSLGARAEILRNPWMSAPVDQWAIRARERRAQADVANSDARDLFTIAAARATRSLLSTTDGAKVAVVLAAAITVGLAALGLFVAAAAIPRKGERLGQFADLAVPATYSAAGVLTLALLGGGLAAIARSSVRRRRRAAAGQDPAASVPDAGTGARRWHRYVGWGLAAAGDAVLVVAVVRGDEHPLTALVVGLAIALVGICVYVLLEDYDLG